MDVSKACRSVVVACDLAHKTGSPPAALCDTLSLSRLSSQPKNLPHCRPTAAPLPAPLEVHGRCVLCAVGPSDFLVLLPICCWRLKRSRHPELESLESLSSRSTDATTDDDDSHGLLLHLTLWGVHHLHGKGQTGERNSNQIRAAGGWVCLHQLILFFENH